MKFALIAADQIIVMFIIMILGIFMYKIKVIGDDTNKDLSNVLLVIINPLLLFSSYQTEYNSHLAKGLLLSFALSLLSVIVSMVISYIAISKKNNKDYLVERFSAIYSNCGFFGIPLINSLFGVEGLFYLTAYMTVFNIFIWSHGVSMMVGKLSIGEILKLVKSPAMIAIILGLCSFFLRIQMPNVIMQPIQAVTAMNTPLAMIIAGVAISKSNIIEMLKNRKIYFVSFIKLLLIPIVLIFIFKPFNASDMVLTTIVILSACPTATMGTMFAIKYGRDYKYTSEIYAVSTLLSVVSIPIVVYLLGIL
jgi:malate permease and related proteins